MKRLSATTLLLSTVTCGLALSLPSDAGAKESDYRASATTYFRGYVRPGADATAEFVPFMELLQLSTRDVGVQGLSIQASLWGRVQLIDIPVGDERVTGDVNTLFVSYRFDKKDCPFRGLEIRAGRQFISVGPAIYDQIDGGYVNYRSPFGLDVTAFGGLTTGVRFLHQSWALGNNDTNFTGWVAGGRLGYRLMSLATLGVSYRHKRFDGEVAFHEVGWDVVVHAIDSITLIGDGVFELTAERLKEGRAAIRFDVLKNLMVLAGYRYREPDLFIPRTSIFSVFSDWTHQEIYGEAYWSPKRWLSITAEGGALLYSETCNLNTYGGKTCDNAETEIRLSLRADMRLGWGHPYRLSALIERVGAPDGGLTRGRIGARAKLYQALAAIVELDLFHLDKRDNQDVFVTSNDHSRWGFVGAGYLTYAVTPKLSVMAGGQGGTSPQLKNYGAFMLRVNWLIDGAPIKGAAVAVSRSAAPTALASLPGGAL
jgi:hypothetical protein